MGWTGGCSLVWRVRQLFAVVLSHFPCLVCLMKDSSSRATIAIAAQSWFGPGLVPVQVPALAPAPSSGTGSNSLSRHGDFAQGTLLRLSAT